MSYRGKTFVLVAMAPAYFPETPPSLRVIGPNTENSSKFLSEWLLLGPTMGAL